jgi:hypothetical protein
MGGLFDFFGDDKEQDVQASGSGSGGWLANLTGMQDSRAQNMALAAAMINAGSAVSGADRRGASPGNLLSAGASGFLGGLGQSAMMQQQAALQRAKAKMAEMQMQGMQQEQDAWKLAQQTQQSGGELEKIALLPGNAGNAARELLKIRQQAEYQRQMLDLQRAEAGRAGAGSWSLGTVDDGFGNKVPVLVNSKTGEMRSPSAGGMPNMPGGASAIPGGPAAGGVAPTASGAGPLPSAYADAFSWAGPGGGAGAPEAAPPGGMGLSAGGLPGGLPGLGQPSPAAVTSALPGNFGMLPSQGAGPAQGQQDSSAPQGLQAGKIYNYQGEEVPFDSRMRFDKIEDVTMPDGRKVSIQRDASGRFYREFGLPKKGIAPGVSPEQAENVLSAIDKARKLAGPEGYLFIPNTGLAMAAPWGWLNGISGSAANDLAMTLDTINANISFDRLQEMRASSPTGGALGQVTEPEHRMLKASLASLDQSQSEEQFLENLGTVEQRYLNIVHGKGNWGYDKNGEIKVGYNIGKTLSNKRHAKIKNRNVGSYEEHSGYSTQAQLPPGFQLVGR